MWFRMNPIGFDAILVCLVILPFLSAALFSPEFAGIIFGIVIAAVSIIGYGWSIDAAYELSQKSPHAKKVQLGLYVILIISSALAGVVFTNFHMSFNGFWTEFFENSVFFSFILFIIIILRASVTISRYLQGGPKALPAVVIFIMIMHLPIFIFYLKRLIKRRDAS